MWNYKPYQNDLNPLEKTRSYSDDIWKLKTEIVQND